jgi:hypothetical protein
MFDSVFEDVYTSFGNNYNLERYIIFCREIEKDYLHTNFNIDKEFSHYNTLESTIHKFSYIKMLVIKYSRKKKLDRIIRKLRS